MPLHSPNFEKLYQAATTLPGANRVTALQYRDGSFSIAVGEEARHALGRISLDDRVTAYFSNCSVVGQGEFPECS